MSSWSKLAASSHEVTAVTGGRRAHVVMLRQCSDEVFNTCRYFPLQCHSIYYRAVFCEAGPKYFMAFNAHPFDLPPTVTCYNLAIMLAPECEHG